MANVVTNPTADQTIGSHNLLPAAANATQSLGSSSARWVANLIASTVGSLDNIIFVDGITYTTIQSAIDQLPVNGGVVVCPPGYTETISKTIILGDGSSKAVILRLMANVNLTLTGSLFSGSAFVIHNNSGIVGDIPNALGTSPRKAGCVISLAADAVLTNVITSGDNPQGTILLQRFDIDNVNGGTVTGAFVNLVNINNVCVISEVSLAYFPCKGFNISATTGGTKTVGPIVLDNCAADGVGKAGARPLVITSDGSGAINGIIVQGGYYLDCDSSKACIEINGNGGTTGTCRDILLSEVYTQQFSTKTSVTGIKIVDAAGVIVQGCEFQLTSATSGHTGLSINESVAGATHAVVVSNFRFEGGSGNIALNNIITTEQILASEGTGNVLGYIYQGTTGTQLPSPWIIGRETTLQVSGTLTLPTESPTSAGTGGATGQLVFDGSNLYVCTAGGPSGSATWKKTALTLA
jgi:hypothetical protein